MSTPTGHEPQQYSRETLQLVNSFAELLEFRAKIPQLIAEAERDFARREQHATGETREAIQRHLAFEEKQTAIWLSAAACSLLLLVVLLCVAIIATSYPSDGARLAIGILIAILGSVAGYFAGRLNNHERGN